MTFEKIELTYKYNDIDEFSRMEFYNIHKINKDERPLTELTDIYNGSTIGHNNPPSLVYKVITDNSICYSPVEWRPRNEFDVGGNMLMNVPHSDQINGQYHSITELESITPNAYSFQPQRIVWTSQNNTNTFAMQFVSSGVIKTVTRSGGGNGGNDMRPGDYFDSGNTSGETEDTADYEQDEEYGCGGDQYHYDEDNEEYVPIENTYEEGTDIYEPDLNGNYEQIKEKIATLKSKPVYINEAFTYTKTWQSPYVRSGSN